MSEITLEEISQVDAEMATDLLVGDTYVEIIDPMIFGRRMIHMAKQFFSQRLQDVEKKYIFYHWKSLKPHKWNPYTHRRESGNNTFQNMHKIFTGL